MVEILPEPPQGFMQNFDMMASLFRPKPKLRCGKCEIRTLLTVEQAEERGIVRREGDTIHVNVEGWHRFAGRPTSGKGNR
jgi:hypothetical protein